MKIYELIRTEQESFRQPIPLQDGFDFNFPDHIRKTVLYKNSIFTKNHSENKPFKNILEPILSLRYRSEGFDVKDIILFVDDVYKNFKSFIIRKYHQKWARKVKLDTFIDELVESYVDFGGALVKKTKGDIPEVVPLQRIAFCDQSNMLGGPICEKHFYSPDELREEAEGRGWKEVEEAITLSKDEKEVGQNKRQAKTPGKYIEVFELHGMFPKYCLNDEHNETYEKGSPEMKLIRQVHICVLYTDSSGNKGGITLYKGTEKDSPYKQLIRKPIYGRALGRGGAEELFQDQIWTNYGQIRMKEMLDACAKILYKTTDPGFANRNKTESYAQGEILVLEDGKDIGQIDTTPRSLQLFDNFVREWEIHSKQIGGAGEAILGEEPAAGTPFKSVEFQARQSFSEHKYHQGKISTFVADELYPDWIISKIVKEVNQGQEFMAELDADELQEVASGVARCVVNKAIRKGMRFTPDLVQRFQEEVKQNFLNTGNKQFVEALKDELKDAPVGVEVSIASKQKDLSAKTDKLVNILRFMLSTFNPQTGQFTVFQDPRMVKLFRQILEASGLEGIDLASGGYTPPPQPQQVQQVLQRPQAPQLTEAPTL